MADRPETEPVPSSPLHPVAVPCLRSHCFYEEMEQRMLTDLTYRQKLVKLEMEVPTLRKARQQLEDVRLQLQVFASELMSGPRQVRRDDILARLTTVGL